MATETASMPVNGNYGPHQGYGGVEQQQNNYAYAPPTASSNIAAPPAPAQTPPVGATNTSQQSDIPKDEVGWYFVEQYYTTLSRSPEKLYLFYNKRSQFVSGQETDKVAVCVGQRAINDRIKELDFQDCKVRVTNVDSQSSDSNIVIQVIGEISNKSQPHKKFTQTFVLATQTNGYFVLNDIFRYLIDEEDVPEPDVEPGVEEAAQVPEPTADSDVADSTAEAVEPNTLTSSTDPAAVEQDAQHVDQELEQKELNERPLTPEESAVNGSSQDEAEEPLVEDAPSAPAVATEEVPSATASNAGVENVKPEQPKTPDPTPAETPAKEPTPEPAAAPKAAAPKTWASLAASANKVATPAAPQVPSPTSQGKSSTSTVKPAPTATSTTPTAPTAPATNAPQTAPSAPAAQRDESPAAGSQGEEWTAVGGSHNRQHSRQVNQPQEQPNYRGFIKNVHSNINPDELKAALGEVAEVTYFDVAHEKVCHPTKILRQHSLTSTRTAHLSTLEAQKPSKPL
jgi:hypothetical protein